MLRTKKADRIAAFFTAVMLIAAVCIWGVVEPVQGDGSREIGYESLLFDTGRVHTIDITASNWDEVIANAAAEEYQECSITIDGENLGLVGIRAKGNTSLSSVATLGSTRYSFKVEFNHYTKGKTYHGLDKLSLNNLIQDATMMKDYLAYTLMGRMGVPSSLCSYVQINVNGEPWGLYLAVEGVEDAFAERNSMTKGELYKPDSMSFGGGRGNGRDFDIENFREKEEDSAEETGVPAGETPVKETQAPALQDGHDDGSFGGSAGAPAGAAAPQMPQGGTDFGGSSGMPAGAADGPEMQQPDAFGPSGGESAANGETADGTEQQETPSFPAAPGKSNTPGGFGGGFGGFNFGMGSEDVKLIYSGDDPESYSNIFNNAKTNITSKDKTRLIESLKKLNEKEDLDSVVNKEEVISYLAVHSFLCNDDSYTGMMVHNYYLYEEKGKLSIIPWDYNLGFGGFSASANATSTVNSPIDSPVTGGTADSRPLIAWIFSDEGALAAYHEAYDRFISENIESGWLAEEISRVQEMITPYVEKDPSAFYSREKFEKAVSTLQTFCAKRGESVRGQLEGTIPSTSAGQRSSEALIDASEISTADMGSMNGAGGGGMPGGESSGGGPGGMPSGMPDMGIGGMPSGMPELGAGGTPPEIPSGLPDSTADFAGSAGSSGASASQNPEAPAGTEAPPRATEIPAAQETVPAAGATQEPENRADGTQRPEPPGSGSFPGGGSMPGGFPGGEGFTGGGYSSGVWIWTACCAAALLALILIVRKAGSHNS